MIAIPVKTEKEEGVLAPLFGHAKHFRFIDENVINDIIKQALSIPSFTLIIANFSTESNPEIEKLKALEDKRIIILEQGDTDISTFVGFVENVMPDLYEEEETEFIVETMNKLYSLKENDSKNETIISAETTTNIGDSDNEPE